MSRPPAARDKVLAAFATIVAEQGEQAATIEAVAAHAGVSKGGLLYHFGSREALVEGLVERLLADGEEDIRAMRAAPEGPVAYYLSTSADSPRELNELYVAASRITQTGAETARRALAHVESAWLAVLEETVSDPRLAHLLAVVGDGLYLHAIRGDQAKAVDLWHTIAPVIASLVEADRDDSGRGATPPSLSRS